MALHGVKVRWLMVADQHSAGLSASCVFHLRQRMYLDTSTYLAKPLMLTQAHWYQAKTKPRGLSLRGMGYWKQWLCSFWLWVSTMALSALISVLEIKNGVLPGTIATCKLTGPMGMTNACWASKVLRFPKRNVTSHLLRKTLFLTSGCNALMRSPTNWLPITVLVAPLSRTPSAFMDRSCATQAVSSDDGVSSLGAITFGKVPLTSESRCMGSLTVLPGLFLICSCLIRFRIGIGLPPPVLWLFATLLRVSLSLCFLHPWIHFQHEKYPQHAEKNHLGLDFQILGDWEIPRAGYQEHRWLRRQQSWTRLLNWKVHLLRYHCLCWGIPPSNDRVSRKGGNCCSECGFGDFCVGHPMNDSICLLIQTIQTSQDDPYLWQHYVKMERSLCDEISLQDVCGHPCMLNKPRPIQRLPGWLPTLLFQTPTLTRRHHLHRQPKPRHTRPRGWNRHRPWRPGTHRIRPLLQARRWSHKFEASFLSYQW